MMGSPIEKCPLRAAAVTVVNRSDPEVPEHGKHAQQEARVANAVHNECLVGRVAGRIAMEIKSDQQI